MNNNTKSIENNDSDKTTDEKVGEIKKKYLDIQGILEKIKNLPIDDDDKVTILQQFKDNILNPSRGENERLDQLQAKYIGSPPQIQPINFPPVINPQQQQQQQHQPLYGYPMPNFKSLPTQQSFMAGDMMTTAHFEILKNKLDSLQLELIDLLRHVKDYTQRYMNAVRQQDLDKIDDYINGLFNVEKTLKETREAAATPPQGLEEEETPPETKEGLIAKATSGIKSFIGSIGNNVSSITNLVSSTADVANSYLSKKIISSPETNTDKQTNNKSNTNTNVVSVEE